MRKIVCIVMIAQHKEKPRDSTNQRWRCLLPTEKNGKKRDQSTKKYNQVIE